MGTGKTALVSIVVIIVLAISVSIQYADAITWITQVSGTASDLNDVTFVDPLTGWAVGDSTTIIATTDGGATWASQGTMSLLPGSPPLRGVDFVDPMTGWTVGEGGQIHKTTDGGATLWTFQINPALFSGTALRSVSAVDPLTAWAVGDGGIILATTDGGATWVPQVSGFPFTLNSVEFVDPLTGWTVGVGGAIFKTTDGGATWIPQVSGTAAPLNDVVFVDPLTGWAVGDGGTIIATTDGGTTWIPQASGTGVILRSVDFVNSLDGYVVGVGGTILRTTNGGMTWIPQTSGTGTDLNAIAFVDLVRYVVGDSGLILKCPIVTVDDFQKISDTEGDFDGVLDDTDVFGFSAASIGDLDGDGIPDLAVGAKFDDDGGVERGAVWILFMNSDGTVKSEQKISDTAGDFDGVLDSGDNFGSSVASIGDLDGDGISELAVGAPFDALPNKGAVWILFLESDGTTKAGAAGFQKIAESTGDFAGSLDNQDLFGTSVASIGDLDGDGIPDLAVGARGDDDGGSGAEGAVWILFLESDGTTKAGTAGFQKISDTAGDFDGVLDGNDHFGVSIAPVGDLDGNGVTDLAVGADGDNDGGTDRGAVWILFLESDGTTKSGTAGFQKISDTAGDFTGILDDTDVFGISVAAIGDLDGNGVTDLAVGATRDGDGGVLRGAVWILFLESDGTTKAGVEGFLKISDTAGDFTGILDDIDFFGSSVASIGDLDGDGISELAVGAEGDDDGGTNRGAVWILFLDSKAVPTLKITKNTIGGDDSFDFNVLHGLGGTDKIIVTDKDNDKVKVFDSTGSFLLEFDGTGSSGTFNDPFGVTVDSSDNIIVTDRNNNKVKVFDSTGSFLLEFDGTGSSGTFNLPRFVEVDSSDNIIVADAFNNKVKVFDSTGSFLLEFDGTGSSGTFNIPDGVMVDSSGRIIVADANNNKVKVFDSTGSFLLEFDGTGSSGTFNFPEGVTVDSSDNIIVADTNNNKVKVFDSTGSFLLEFDGTGSSGTFNGPFGVTVDDSDNIIVADANNNKVKVFDSTGSFLLEFDGTGSSGTFSSPTDVSFRKDPGTQIIANIPDTSTNNMFGPIPITVGELDVTEIVPAGWDLDSSECTINGVSQGPSVTTDLTVSLGDEIICTFENEKETTLKIIKNVVGGDDTFDFTGSDGAGPLPPISINTNVVTMFGPLSITPGNLDVSETVPAGWNLDSSDCTINGAPQGSTTSLTVDPSDEVICTFTNEVTGGGGPDVIPPVVTPPPNQVVVVIGPTSTSVNFPSPGATDNVGVTTGPTCNPPSGSTFPVGTTIVTCTAEDAAGNVGQATFQITITGTGPGGLPIGPITGDVPCDRPTDTGEPRICVALRGRG